jgi:hypothetical protein
MTAPRLQPPELPGWPRWLSEILAAAYVGLSPGAFRAEVEAGIWPQPRRGGKGGGRLLWDRDLLDRASDAMSNPSKSAKERMLQGIRGNEEGRSAVLA